MPSNGTDLSRRNVLRATAGGLGVAGLSGVASGDTRVVVNVGFANQEGRNAAAEAADRIKREFDFPAMTIEVAAAAAENLAQSSNVRYVEQNGEMQALEQAVPYGIEQVGADDVIDDGGTGDGVSVAVIDSGIDAQHETLEANLGEGYATTDAACDADCGGGGPFGGGNDIDECLAEWDDDNDHGTHVAGTVGAADDGEGVLGVAPDVTLHAVKVLDCDGGGSFDDIAAGIEWSAQQGHDVQNMSLGADSGSDVIHDAVQYAADEGVVMVAAAGNDGECTDCVGFPAAYEEVIAVSATDENDDLADFSSTGPEVDIAAPGVDTLSTVPRDDYAEFSGTSMASPHVAGGAAQVIADGVTDREEVRSVLLDSATDIGLDENEQGAGRLDVAEAVDAGPDDGDDDDGDDDEDDEDDGEDDEDDGEEEPTDPSVDSLDVDDRSSGPWTRADVSWSVSDPDGDLDSVTTELLDGDSVEDSVTTSVSGDSASGEDDVRTRDDADSVRVTVTDGAGNDASEISSI